MGVRRDSDELSEQLLERNDRQQLLVLNGLSSLADNPRVDDGRDGHAPHELCAVTSGSLRSRLLRIRE